MSWRCRVEAFESFVALAMEDEGPVVTSSVKFPVTRRTAKAKYIETQTHGFEVDLVGANATKLVLASVKSFFGSRGVVARHVDATAGGKEAGLYAMLNDSDPRAAASASPQLDLGDPRRTAVCRGSRRPRVPVEHDVDRRRLHSEDRRSWHARCNSPPAGGRRLEWIAGWQ
jgi:hypothetical protein